jgi:hypothetical protein
VRELGAAFLSPTWPPADGLWRPEDLDGDFTSVSVEAAFDALGLVAAVLPEVFSLTEIGRASAWWPGIARPSGSI